jgi:hypothetical protein
MRIAIPRSVARRVFFAYDQAVGVIDIVANGPGEMTVKRAEVSYAELARRLKEHGLEETEASITAKLNRGTFAATFFLATMRAIGRETYKCFRDLVF